MVGLIILTMMGGELSKFSLFPPMLTNIVWTGPVSCLTGIQFGDNGGQNYVIEENGVATATTKVSKNL